ncbi:DNA repair protein RecO [Synechococcus sp. HK01-R]|uniref:DNA repair protein RecO n=1 Tax=Synechococcus sp. HK01-R TaxID=2751171 RepID=UPI0016287E07|nr:DNA repair protein RecO C-terminal domain-containing protein [Synechococcus sp. HK01-R]QNG27138.1 DNA repair protein RecO C-terminal domain-containing protein [Synechococcus sp. HK01-R]
MGTERRLEGLALKVGPLGEHDRLLTLLSRESGVIRLAVPGARRPRSSLAAAVPLTQLDLQVVGQRGLPRIRQLRVQHSFSAVGQRLETLAGAQALAELCIALVAGDDPMPGLLEMVLLHLERLEQWSRLLPPQPSLALAGTVQACVHLLALGGYGLPLQSCCRSGSALIPPIGQWDWRCSLLAEEGFAIDRQPGAAIQLNPSELALLQRLPRAELPHRRDGELMGPVDVWLRLLTVVECWIRAHLPRPVRSLAMVREAGRS